MENNLKNSIEFLNFKVGKQHGFTVPENYFNELENEIESKKIVNGLPDKGGFELPKNYFNELENELFERVSEVSLPQKTNLGNVPKGYFDSLEDSILGKIKEEDKNQHSKETKVISLSQRIRKFIPVAAAASVLLFVGTYFFITPPITDSQIQETDIVSWFENGYGEANSYELAMLFTNEEFSEEEFTVNLSDDNIEEYFNTIDTSTLIEFEEE